MKAIARLLSIFLALSISGAVPVMAAPLSGSGAEYGVEGTNTDSNTIGRLGYGKYGVYGSSPVPDGVGAYGHASAETGANHGVYGLTDSSEGTAVYGWATADSGTTYGIYGRVMSADGYAGYFVGGKGLYTVGFVMPTGATAGHVLTCDANGTASWQAPATGNITDVAAGNGLTGGGNSGPITLNVGAGTGIEVADDTVSLSSAYIDGSAYDATVSGGGKSGSINTITDNFGTVGGGSGNTAGNGSGTVSDAEYATVSGGADNAASASYATVPGGSANTAAGAYSLAAGRRAKVGATHSGSFVWADSTNSDFNSGAANRFHVRASGGVYLYTASDLSTYAYLPEGSGAWVQISDRSVKRDFDPVDTKAVLEKLASIPILTWRYKNEWLSIRHIGPTAQDWYAAFGLGDSDTAISSVDADGVSMAAIQGLYSIVKEQEREIEHLKEQADAKDKELDAIKERLDRVEALLNAVLELNDESGGN